MEIDMEMNSIPLQLQNGNIGFVKLKASSKIPFERDWQRKPYSFTEITKWIEQGGNYGILGGAWRSYHY